MIFLWVLGSKMSAGCDTIILMKARRRRLIVSRVEYGTPKAGRCSVCHELFEVELGSSEPLSAANERLLALFAQHVCGAESSLAALRPAAEENEKRE